MEPLGTSTKRNVRWWRLNLELLPRNPHGHERALKEEEVTLIPTYYSNFLSALSYGCTNWLIEKSRTAKKPCFHHHVQFLSGVIPVYRGRRNYLILKCQNTPSSIWNCYPNYLSSSICPKTPLTSSFE